MLTADQLALVQEAYELSVPPTSVVGAPFLLDGEPVGLLVIVSFGAPLDGDLLSVVERFA